MYISITITSVTCDRGQGRTDAEVAIRLDGETGYQHMVGKSLTYEKARTLSEEKAQELFQTLSTAAQKWLQQYPKAKE